MKKIADKLTEIAANVERVYDAGYEEGYGSGRAEGLEEGYASGKAEGYEDGYSDQGGRPFESVSAGLLVYEDYTSEYVYPIDCEEEGNEVICLDNVQISRVAYSVDGDLIVPLSFCWSGLAIERIKGIRMRVNVDAGGMIPSSEVYLYPKHLTADGSGGKLEDLELRFVGSGYDMTYRFEIDIKFEVYEEQIEDSVKRTVSFDNWHNGTTDGSLIAFEHGLGVKPGYVAIVADDIEAIKNADMPDGIIAGIIQSDRLYNHVTDEFYISSYVRYSDGSVGVSTVSAENRLISGWDERYVYVNGASGTYAWAPSAVTTYSLICSR